MKLSTLVASLFLLAGFTGTAVAETKIGAINVTKLMISAPQAEKAKKSLEEEFFPRKNSIEAKQEELVKKKQKLERDGAAMSRNEISRMEDDLLLQGRDLRRMQEQFGEDLQIRQREIQGELMGDINKVIQAFAKENGYDLIVGEGTIFASDSLDITEQLLQRLKDAD